VFPRSFVLWIHGSRKMIESRRRTLS
jgi:hypothetical protein